MSLKPFDAKDALISIQKNPKSVWMIEAKKEKPGAKKYKCAFLNVFFNIGNLKKKEGWFNIKDVILTTGVADPKNVADPRNQYDSTRRNLQTTVSNSGDIGQFILASNTPFLERIDELIAEGTIEKGKRDIHQLAQTHVSNESTNKEARGQPIEDPIIRFKIDWGLFPDGYKSFLAGQTKSQFYDYRTKYTDEDGRTQYKLATIVVDGMEVLVNDDNLHLFVTKGSIIREGRIMIQSLSVSAGWISCPMTINRAVIEPGPPEGFSDDCAEVIHDDSGAGATTTVVTTLVNTNDAAINAEAEPNGMEVDNALSELLG